MYIEEGFNRWNKGGIVASNAIRRHTLGFLLRGLRSLATARKSVNWRVPRQIHIDAAGSGPPDEDDRMLNFRWLFECELVFLLATLDLD